MHKQVCQHHTHQQIMTCDFFCEYQLTDLKLGSWNVDVSCSFNNVTYERGTRGVIFFTDTEKKRKIDTN